MSEDIAMASVVANSSGKPSLACARIDSCLGSPSAEFMFALRQNNLSLFVDVLNHGELDVNEAIENEAFDTPLIAVIKEGKVDFLRELLRHEGVNPNVPHQNTKRFPLHLAADKGHLEMIRLLVEWGKADVHCREENGNTPLHTLALRSAARWAKKADETEKANIRRNFVECVRYLLSRPGINVDLLNAIGVSPVYFAIEKGTEEVAKLLLMHGACITQDVDGVTAEQLLGEKMPELLKGLDLTQNRVSRDTTEGKLFQELYTCVSEPEPFIRLWNESEANNNLKVNPDADNGTYTFLQYACDQGMDELVEFLLNKGAEPNLFAVNYKMPPLVIAGHHGYYQILQIFKEFALRGGLNVDFGASDKIRGENVLHKVLKAESKAYMNFEKRNYVKCLDLLLDDNPVVKALMLDALNAPDKIGNTPLHYSAHFYNENATRKLLRCGANIGAKNDKDRTPINEIPPALIEEYLDECLRMNGEPTDLDFRLTFEYGFLGPPLRKGWKTSNEPLDEEEKELNPEDEGSIGLPEAEPLWYISQSPAHRSLLTHPVISSFLSLKWRRIRPYYYINLTFYLLFVACLTAYTLLLANQFKAEKMTAQEAGQSPALSGLKFATTALLILLALRELFQALVSFRRYLFNLENLLEVALVVDVFILLFGGFSSEMVLRNLSGAGLLLSWAEMVLLFGKHPKLSTYITMFSTVSLNFFLFLSWYVSLIVAFGLTFFIVLPMGNDYFLTPDKSLLKTVVMSLTGEIEFEGIDFGGLFAVVLFLLYVFFIMLVLVNLLNGLAVADIGEIQKQAEVVAHVSRVELVSYMESMLLGDPFQFLTNWPPVKMLRRLPSCSCLKSFYLLPPVRKLFDCLLGDTLLFQSRLKKKQATFKPNASRYETSLPQVMAGDGDLVDKKDGLLVERNILDSATELALNRNRVSKDGQETSYRVTTEERLVKLEKGVKLLAQQQNHIIELLNKIARD